MMKPGNEKDRFVFVVGVGRSGTTLLQSMLNSHSQICFSKETHFIKNYIVPEVTKGVRYDVQELLERMNSDQYLTDLAVDFQQIISEVKRVIMDGEFLSVQVFRAYMKRFCRDVMYLGDKDPMNTNYLDVIEQVFPDAKIVHIIRDPRDVVLSRIRSDWGKSRSINSHIIEYDYSLRKACKQGRKRLGLNYFELKYESLLGNPELSLKAICHFLEIDFEKEMLHYDKHSSDLVREKEMKWKSNVLQPILKENIGKWKAIKDEKLKKKLNSKLYPTLKFAGYPNRYDLNAFIKIFSTTNLLITRILIKAVHG